ncbi:DUF1015 domain-containing protein [Blastococcus sp. CT_GayMR16]|uniref:DUF1015 domain-containing protein n=1 Tax=Blastococcus sp. CT_GayMR16 TaxID=2559607 RepID=UPI001073A2FB|nr:DUF1015 domain-containing protein [Blastococcus sp. CT_GayMR16]TFV81352.1 DUF1015 domain-containing protein [Blastococcus sp. CT_GayMR16]
MSSESRSLAASGLEIRPFRALTYRQRNPEHLARVSSPAYDLVTPTSRDRLAHADPHNIVRLILPRPADGGSAANGDPAHQAAVMLSSWQDDGVLDRDDELALWLYELQPPDGAPATVGWVGAVALPPVGSAAVLPHEDTYPGAVEGRRALLAATDTDLEPIVLAHDPEPTVAALTEAARRGDPTLELRDSDGVAHRLWRVTNPATLSQVTAALRSTGAVIADGHHRFAAARANSRAEPPREGSDAVLALVTPMGPGGLRVAPIHRVVPDLALDDALTAAHGAFRVAALPVGDGDQIAVVAAIDRWLATTDESGFLVTDGHRLFQLTHPSESVLATVPSEAPPAWRHLDVVLAHHGLLAGLWQRRDDPESVLIAHTAEDAVRTAAERGGVALLLRAPSPEDVAAVARAGARMPRKSTLFVPKPRTGLVLRPLAD